MVGIPRRFRAIHVWALTLVACLCSADFAAGEDSYFLLVFSWQRGETHLRCTHTLATFVKVTNGNSAADPCQFEAHTISWLPVKMEVHPWRLFPQKGHNFDLEESLHYAVSHNDRISLWGPFQIQEELYNLGLKQIEQLERGSVRYKLIDSGYFVSAACNCIHAVTDLDPPHRRLRLASPGWGEGASNAATLKLKRWLIDPCTIHPWVADLLELDKYPIIHRDLKEPHSFKFGR
ncbi:MAG TPA: hypothetical protein VK395_20870 [Gemmataceae bacterium]|nr:hypothetical protein [Gemmataceae bacterium]